MIIKPWESMSELCHVTRHPIQIIIKNRKTMQKLLSRFQNNFISNKKSKKKKFFSIPFPRAATNFFGYSFPTVRLQYNFALKIQKSFVLPRISKMRVLYSKMKKKCFFFANNYIKVYLKWIIMKERARKFSATREMKYYEPFRTLKHDATLIIINTIITLLLFLLSIIKSRCLNNWTLYYE